MTDNNTTAKVSEAMIDAGEAAYDAVPAGFGAHRRALKAAYLAMQSERLKGDGEASAARRAAGEVAGYVVLREAINAGKDSATWPRISPGEAKNIRTALWDAMAALSPPSDGVSRDADPTKEGIFRDHRCWKCHDGEKPCVRGAPNRCEYPHARND